MFVEPVRNSRQLLVVFYVLFSVCIMISSSAFLQRCIVVLVVAIVGVVGAATSLVAQTRIAVLPFRNTHGSMEYNERCYQLADSIASQLTAMAAADPSITFVPSDSVMEVLSMLNLDPTNPQYESDMWRAVEQLAVDQVVTGTFNVRYNKIFINASVYNVQNKLADNVNAARSIREPLDKMLEAVPVIVEKIFPAIGKK